MKKRGVSPLIASVLLIAFVILLFVVITTWVRRTAIEPGMSSAEEKLAGVLDCVNVKVDVVKACVDTNDKLQLTIDNLGDANIEGVKVRVFGTTGDYESGEIESSTAPFDRMTEKNTGIEIDDASDVTRVEVYPVIKGNKVCQGELEIINSVSDCS